MLKINFDPFPYSQKINFDPRYDWLFEKNPIFHQEIGFKDIRKSETTVVGGREHYFRENFTSEKRILQEITCIEVDQS